MSFKSDGKPEQSRDTFDEVLELLGAGVGAPSISDTDGTAQEPDPEQIDQFVVQGRVGSGGMGVVLRAFDTKLDRPVALKLINTSRTTSQAQRDKLQRRLYREAKLTAKIRHVNVITIHQVGDYGDGVYLVMDLIHGPDLCAWLSEEVRPWRDIIVLFIQAGRGLEAAHEQNLVHRDFKPKNVLVSEQGAIVTDFGLARDGGDSDIEVATGSQEGKESRGPETALTTGMIGTPGYMAPEQWENSTVDHRADQFSFCKALAEALEGRDHSAPPRLRGILERGVQKHPDERWPNMNSLLTAIEAALSKPSVETKPTSISSTRATWAIGAFLVATAAAMAVVFWPRPDTIHEVPEGWALRQPPHPPPKAPEGWTLSPIPYPPDGVYHYAKDDEHVVVFDMRDVELRFLTGELSRTPEDDNQQRIEKHSYSDFETQARTLEDETWRYKALLGGTFATETDQPTPVAFGLKRDNVLVTFGYASPGEHQPELDVAVKLFAVDNLTDRAWVGDYDVKVFAKWPNVMGAVEIKSNLYPNQELGRNFVGVEDADGDGEFERVMFFVSEASTQAHAASVLEEFGAEEQAMLCGGAVPYLSIDDDLHVDSGMLIPSAAAVYVRRH